MYSFQAFNVCWLKSVADNLDGRESRIAIKSTHAVLKRTLPLIPLADVYLVASMVPHSSPCGPERLDLSMNLTPWIVYPVKDVALGGTFFYAIRRLEF
jgi:hypothetical protein